MDFFARLAVQALGRAGSVEPLIRPMFAARQRSAAVGSGTDVEDPEEPTIEGSVSPRDHFRPPGEDPLMRQASAQRAGVPPRAAVPSQLPGEIPAPAVPPPRSEPPTVQVPAGGVVAREFAGPFVPLSPPEGLEYGSDSSGSVFARLPAPGRQPASGGHERHPEAARMVDQRTAGPARGTDPSDLQAVRYTSGWLPAVPPDQGEDPADSRTTRRLTGDAPPEAAGSRSPAEADAQPVSIVPRAAVEAERIDPFRTERVETESQPVVRITIGRVEVKAVAPPAPSARPAILRPDPRLGLEEYLRQRRGGDR